MEPKKKTILFLSEGSLFCEFAKECFKQDGHEFFDFCNWNDCKGQILDLSPDAILVDLDNYPIESLSEISSSYKIIGFYSDYLESVVEGLTIDGLIKKPLTPTEIVSKPLSLLES